MTPEPVRNLLALVDAVLDLSPVVEAEIQPTPDVASGMAKTATQGLLAMDGRMMSLVASDHILWPTRQAV